MAKREKRAEGGGGRRRRSSSSASPILMCFFDRPWNYAWWFLKCFNWSGPKLEPNSILGGRQYVCFFCLFCSVLFSSVLKMQKWATQLKFQKHSLYLKKSFFQLPKQSSLSASRRKRFSTQSKKATANWRNEQISLLFKLFCKFCL